MAKMVDVNTMWKCETCFHHKNEGCSPEIWCENGEAYRPDCNKLVFVEAEPVKHGKWIEKYGTWYCSECDKTGYKGYIPAKPSDYCPNCGARMDE